MITPLRSVRIADDPWVPASERATREGTDISKVIREFLAGYAAGQTQEQTS